jgi:hypothetical protein
MRLKNRALSLGILEPLSAETLTQTDLPLWRDSLNLPSFCVILVSIEIDNNSIDVVNLMYIHRNGRVSARSFPDYRFEGMEFSWCVRFWTGFPRK